MTTMLDGVRSRIDRLGAMYGRATLGPMLVRVVVGLAGCAAFAVALPTNVLASPAALAFVLVAALPAVAPRGPVPTGVITIVTLAWLVNTGFDGTTINVFRLASLAIFIYVIHAGSAFAAVLPYDAVVSPGLFLPWVMRAVYVSVLTVGVALFVLAVPGFVGTDHHLVAATLVGFVLMITMAIYLSYLGNRRQ